jgi:hypothetical protein
MNEDCPELLILICTVDDLEQQVVVVMTTIMTAMNKYISKYLILGIINLDS